MSFGRFIFFISIAAGALCCLSGAASADTSGGLQLIGQSFTTNIGESFELDIQLPGVISDTDQLTIAIYEPVTNEEQFIRTTLGQNLGGVLDSRNVDINQLQADAWGQATITLPISSGGSSGIRIARPGVYPLSLEMRTSDQELIGRLITYLIRTEEIPTPPLPIVMVAKIDKPIINIEASISEYLSWLEVLDNFASIPVSIAITPFRDLAESLMNSRPSNSESTHEWIRSPLIPIDEASLVDAGLQQEVNLLWDMGSDSLSKLGQLAPTTFWIGHSESEPQFEARWERGIREAIISAEAVALPPDAGPRGPIEIRINSSTIRALVIDELSPKNSDDTAASHAQRVLAHLAIIALSDKSQPIVTVDLNKENHGSRFADHLLQGIDQLGWVKPELASLAVARPLLTVDNQPLQYELISTPSPSTADFVKYREARRHLNAFRSMVRDEDAQEYESLSLDLLFSLATELPEHEQQAFWDSIIDMIRRQTSLVDIPPDESIQLTSQEAAVPFSFQNRAEVPLRVELRIISERLTVQDFDDGESTTLVLQPGVTTHRFRLKTLGSGSFPIAIELHSPNGGLLIGQAQAALRATTPTGVGLGLIIGAFVFLASWWLLDTRRRKRRTL